MGLFCSVEGFAGVPSGAALLLSSEVRGARLFVSQAILCANDSNVEWSDIGVFLSRDASSWD